MTDGIFSRLSVFSRQPVFSLFRLYFLEWGGATGGKFSTSPLVLAADQNFAFARIVLALATQATHKKIPTFDSVADFG